MEQSGKRCVHLWAMAMYELCGPLGEFEENAAVIREHLLHGSQGKSGLPDKLPSTADLQDFQAYWGYALSQPLNLSALDLGGPKTAVRTLNRDSALRNAPGDIPLSSNATSDHPSHREISPIGRRNRVARINTSLRSEERRWGEQAHPVIEVMVRRGEAGPWRLYQCWYGKS